MAVTAYQNERVTQLKVRHNPFAKAFLDSRSGDADLPAPVTATSNCRQVRVQLQTQEHLPLPQQGLQQQTSYDHSEHLPIQHYDSQDSCGFQAFYSPTADLSQPEQLHQRAETAFLTPIRTNAEVYDSVLHPMPSTSSEGLFCFFSVNKTIEDD